MLLSTAQSMLDTLRAGRPGPGEARHFYLDRDFARAAVKVSPGEYFVSRDDILIMTVLGSCIAACLWDPLARVGGMNHFVLPDGGPAQACGRHGLPAMEILIDALERQGGSRRRLQAKVFGGAQVMASFRHANVGKRNAAFVTRYLRDEGIGLVATDVLGAQARQLCFFPATGQALVRRLASTPLSGELPRERLRLASRAAVRGDSFFEE